MGTARQLDLVSVEDYLAGELLSPVKHEYLAGVVYAIAGARYLLIEQSEPAVVVFRRTDSGFVREAYLGLDAVIPLGEIGTELPLAEIYDGVELTPEVDEIDN